MLNTQAYLQYQKTSMETTSPGKLLLMLFDGGIKSLHSAKVAIDDKDINKAHHEIIRVQDIVMELMSTLKMDYEISKSLMALYEYYLQQLVEANVKKDKAILDEVLDFFTQMHDAWEQAIKHLGPAPALSAEPMNKLNISG